MAQITYEIRYMCWHQSTSGFTDIIRYKGIGCDPSLKIPHKMSRSTFMYSIECYVSYVNGIVTPAQYSGSDLLYIKTMFFFRTLLYIEGRFSYIWEYIIPSLHRC